VSSSQPQGSPAYWQAVLDEVSALSDSAVAVESLPIRSNETSIAHGLRFEGVGGYPLFAYFTVPRGEGPFPALFQTPGYGSVVGVPAYERRSRYAVMALCHRGQRLSDSGYSAAYPGLLTDGLPGADTYVYRGVAADCLRAFDVFTARPEVDSSRLAVAGMDLAAITAALRPQTPLMLVTAMTFRAAAERAPLTRAYPMQELNDFARTHPGDAAEAADTLSLFDPLAFAPRIGARALFTCGRDELKYVEPVVEAMPGEAQVELRTGRGFIDHGVEEEWLERMLLA
jgi:cephalosporin-C deacetylase-like acetyl esterase